MEHEQDPAKRRALLTTAILVAAHSKLFESDFLWELFKEDEMRLNDDPVLNKLYEKLFAAHLERTKQEIEETKQTLEQAKQQAVAEAIQAREVEIRRAVEHELVLAHVAQREAEAARREAEAAQREAEAMLQWQETLLKILEHRFQQAPIQLWRTLQQVPVSKRNQVTDLALDATTVEELLTGLNQLIPKSS